MTEEEKKELKEKLEKIIKNTLSYLTKEYIEYLQYESQQNESQESDEDLIGHWDTFVLEDNDQEESVGSTDSSTSSKNLGNASSDDEQPYYSLPEESYIQKNYYFQVLVSNLNCLLNSYLDKQINTQNLYRKVKTYRETLEEKKCPDSSLMKVLYFILQDCLEMEPMLNISSAKKTKVLTEKFYDFHSPIELDKNEEVLTEPKSSPSAISFAREIPKRTQMGTTPEQNFIAHDPLAERYKNKISLPFYKSPTSPISLPLKKKHCDADNVEISPFSLEL